MEIKLEAQVVSIQYAKEIKISLIVFGGNEAELARFRNAVVRVSIKSMQGELPEPKADDTVQFSMVDRETGELHETAPIPVKEFSRLVDRVGR